MHSLEGFDDAVEDSRTGYLSYEIVDEAAPLKRRTADSRPVPRSDSHESPWGKTDDRDALPTKNHVNRRFDDLQRTVCGAVGQLHGEVAALKLALAASETVEADIPELSPGQRIDTLAAAAGTGEIPELRELFDLISEFEIVPSTDVAGLALESLKSSDNILRAAAAGALGVIRPSGATPALAVAFEAESNRHIKKMIGRSLKATIQ